MRHNPNSTTQILWYFPQKLPPKTHKITQEKFNSTIRRKQIADQYQLNIQYQLRVIWGRIVIGSRIGGGKISDENRRIWLTCADGDGDDDDEGISVLQWICLYTRPTCPCSPAHSYYHILYIYIYKENAYLLNFYYDILFLFIFICLWQLTLKKEIVTPKIEVSQLFRKLLLKKKLFRGHKSKLDYKNPGTSLINK